MLGSTKLDRVNALKILGDVIKIKTDFTCCNYFLRRHNPFRLTRRDAESQFGRFWRFEDTTVTFFPLSADEPRLGGKVQASVKGFDVRTFTPYTKTYFGVYGEDFVTYG